MTLHGLDRRGFLRRASLTSVAVAGSVAAGAANAQAVESTASIEPQSNYPFEGEHQAGILTPLQKASSFVAFDLTVKTKEQFAGLMKTLTGRIRFLTTGGEPAPAGIVQPPTDSGTLGTSIDPDGLTITVSLGASVFDGRFGLASQKPKHLIPMETFPNDDLQESWCHGDLSLQICAHNIDTVLHAVRDITRATRGQMQVRWRQDGFVSPSRPDGAPRNHFGFKDGTSNPDTNNADEMKKLVWASSDEPAWAAGGSYQVIRLIAMLVEFWDRVNLNEQESMIGRARDTGATLDKNHESEAPSYTDDPMGTAIPLTAHIRKANPRTSETDNSRILRRGYNYSGGMKPNGNLDLGLIFTCYQQDIDRQFAATQRRLADEPLVDYISPFGGGYFYTLPGVRGADDFLARTLLS